MRLGRGDDASRVDYAALKATVWIQAQKHGAGVLTMPPDISSTPRPEQLALPPRSGHGEVRSRRRQTKSGDIHFATDSTICAGLWRVRCAMVNRTGHPRQSLHDDTDGGAPKKHKSLDLSPSLLMTSNNKAL